MPSAAHLAAALGLSFAQPQLLESALTHRSFLNEHPERHSELVSNERLEFLGDAVLNMLAAQLVFARFPGEGEGALTELRAELVRTTTLAAYARSLDLGSYLRLSRGEQRAQAAQRDSLLADAFEALVGAVFLDQGLDAALLLLMPMFEQQLHAVATRSQQPNYRSVLQERIQSQRSVTPRYVVVSSAGPEHQRQFTVDVLIGAERLGTGQGASKQAASQAAARDALARLDPPDDHTTPDR
jgi:ribonuclease-3